MSILRHVVKKDTSESDADVEAQPLIGVEDKGLSSPPPKTASKTFAAIPAAGHNPILLAKLFFRKVIGLLLNSDEDDLSQPGGMRVCVIKNFQDLLIGVIFSALLFFCLIFLDHQNIVHFRFSIGS